MGKGWDDSEDGYGRNTKWLRTWRNQELQMLVFKKGHKGLEHFWRTWITDFSDQDLKMDPNPKCPLAMFSRHAA